MLLQNRQTEQRTSRQIYTATWLFLLCYFMYGVGFPSGRLVALPPRLVELVGMTVLVIGAVIGQRVRLKALPRVFIPLWFGLIVVAIWTTSRVHPKWATESSYVLSGLYYTATYATAVAFTVLFYDETSFVQLFWKIARISIVVALAAYGVALVIGRPVLSSGITFGAPLRLQGLLAEPSAWAPVVAAVAIIAWRRRAWRWLVLAGIAGVLAKSPVVIVVTAVSIPLFYVLIERWKGRKVLLLGVILITVPLAANFLLNANPAPYLNSKNPAQKSVGKLLVGIQADPDVRARNATARLESTQATLKEIRASHWTFTGYGPGSSGPYFKAKYRPDNPTVRGVAPNALWIETYFNFGVLGLIALMWLIGIAVVRMRTCPDAAAVFLPFVVAAMVNSAHGVELYKFVVVAIVVFTFGWSPDGSMAKRETHRPTASLFGQAQAASR